MTRHRRLFFLFAASVLFLLSGCDSESPPPILEKTPPPAIMPKPRTPMKPLEEQALRYIDREPNTPTVGLMIPLSGNMASIGESILAASMLAFSELGIDTCRLRVVDTQGTPEGAREAAKELAKAEAKIVFGPVFAQEVKAAAPIFARSHVPMVAFSNSLSVAQKNVFIFGLNPDDEISTFLAFAMTQSVRRFVAVIPESEYGEGVLHAINVALAERQRHIFAAGSHQQALQLGVVRYRQGETRAEEFEQRCSALSFDAAIVLEPESETASMLVKVLKKKQENALIFGLSAWKDASFAFVPEIEGAYIALPPQDGSSSFETRYRKTFGKECDYPFCMIAFDAIVILTQIDDFSTLTPQWFAKENSFLGLAGEARFTQNGHVHRTLRVYQIKNHGIVPAQELQTQQNAPARREPLE
ncbi:MAG: penicillin-binding protein activator [Holosporales bacterium]|nr:penicillin-binding protein activator [Holosporales bacterium]